ncbi:MAG TPA: nucleoside kinase [Bellilinea sp.]|nr:nucleoside kinase [Bellilinea sp.]
METTITQKFGEPSASSIQLETALRPRVEIQLPDGRVYSGPRGATLEDFFRSIAGADKPLVVGAIVNHDLRELTQPVLLDAQVTPVTMADADGARIYRRSLTFLLEAAFSDLFPDAILTVDYSVTAGGYYCQVSGRAALNEQEVALLEQKMGVLVHADIPFTRENVPIDEARAFFTEIKHFEKVRLLKYRTKPTLVLYRLGMHRDYYHGYMVPSSGYLRWFRLEPMEDGFILRYPRRHAPEVILPLPESALLINTFRQYGAWLNRLGIDSVGALNDSISAGRINEVILVSEALHEQKIAEIARKIVARAGESRIVLIAGPSSSGKTTFSRRLSVQLLAYGLSPVPVEMDNYFVDRDLTPLDEFGHFDFEALHTLNIERLEKDLIALIAGEEVQLPHYNFRKGLSEPGDVLKLEKDQIIILEGIHGLNPQLLPHVNPGKTFKIYASCLTQLNLDRHNRISTTDSRLIRRIVRDQRERGYSAGDTIGRWESVRRGEKKHIFPYQENSDEIFNSALVYELAALRPLAEPVLRQVPYGAPEFIEAKRLLAFLEWFLPLDAAQVPDNSILREFLGGSILKNFKLWGENSNADLR